MSEASTLFHHYAAARHPSYTTAGTASRDSFRSVPMSTAVDGDADFSGSCCREHHVAFALTSVFVGRPQSCTAGASIGQETRRAEPQQLLPSRGDLCVYWNDTWIGSRADLVQYKLQPSLPCWPCCPCVLSTLAPLLRFEVGYLTCNGCGAQLSTHRVVTFRNKALKSPSVCCFSSTSASSTPRLSANHYHGSKELDVAVYYCLSLSPLLPNLPRMAR